MNLVTGGTGLLGSHIVEQLCRRGRPVRVLVRSGSDTSWLRTQPVEIATGDVTDRDSLARAMPGVHTVFHAAARVGDWGPWSEFQAVTIDGTRNVVQAAEQGGVRRFIHISSISVYGYVDGEGRVFDETAPLGYGLYRWAYYSRAKVEAEKIIWSAQERGRVAFTVIRPSWLYGQRDRATISRLVASLRAGRAKLIGDGENRLNVVNAANVAEAAILAADLPRAAGQAYNCSNDGVLTQKDYFNRVAQAAGARPVTRRVPYRLAYGVAFVLECLYRLFRIRRAPLITRYSVWLIGRRCYFETRKACRELGWKSGVSYDDGIPAAVAAYLKGADHGCALPGAAGAPVVPASSPR